MDQAPDSSSFHRSPRLAVVLPAYNEELTIVGTIAAFAAALPEAALVVVDNASTDRTAELAATALASLPDGRLLREGRRGKAAAVRRAFHETSADAYLMVDADLTYPAERARDLLAPVLAGQADMVVGDRLAEGRYDRENRRAFHGFGNRLVLALVNRLFGARLRDILSGYRAMSRRFVEHYPILVDGFELEVDLTLHALDKRFRVLELPVEYRDRPPGSSSKLSTFADGRRVLSTIVHVVRHYRPLLFFGGLGLALGLFGLLVAAPVVDDWFRYRHIVRLPLAVLATGLELLAALSVGIGLILDSVAHLERQAYERDLLADRDRTGRGGQ